MAAAAEATAQIAIAEPTTGRVVVAGELSFATAREAREAGLRALEACSAPAVLMDLGGVTRADSAGLAVLLEWLAWGRRKNRQVALENVPQPLLAIARISELDGLLSASS